MKLFISIILILILATGYSNAQQNPVFLKEFGTPWVDSLMNNMSLDQKIGQLFMVQAYSNKKNQNTEEVLKYINQFQVGGIIFMQGGPVALANICNQLQQNSNIPLLVAIDAENG